MLWQVASGFAYRTTGGYFIGSDAEHDLLLEAPVTAYQQGAVDVAGGAPPPTGRRRRGRRATSCARWG